MHDGAIEHVNGLRKGKLRELYDAVASSGVKIYLSSMSSKSRGLTKAELEGKLYEFAAPNQLVQLAVEHDRMFTY